MDLWMKSLRVDPSRTRRSDVRLNQSKSSPPSTTKPPTAAKLPPRPDAKKNAGTVLAVSEGTVVNSPQNCSNLCCNVKRPDKFAQSRFEAIMTESRTNYYVDASAAGRIRDEISAAQTLHTSYGKELARLKRVLAARPPNQALSVSSKSNLCMHACCHSSYPLSRASPEWLRLCRIIQRLQFKCRETSQYLSAKRYLLAPIRRLPPELLQEVFLFAVISDAFEVFASSDVTFGKAIGAIRLAHACSYWRTIALNTGQLWATILLRLPPSDRSGITQFNFHVSHAKSAPLTILCYEWADWWVLRKLARVSHRWRTVRLVVDHEVYLKREDNDTRTIDAFEDAPSLRRVTLSVSQYDVWPFRFILPWRQITSLKLTSIAFPVFSECLQECPQLLYFQVQISLFPEELGQQAPVSRAVSHSSLRKLLVQGYYSQEAIIMHTFPRLRSLSITGSPAAALHRDFCAFLSRSSHLEMLSIAGWYFATREDLLTSRMHLPVELRLATPSLRILHLRNEGQNWRAAVVTPRFYTPVVTPSLDAPFAPVQPRSLTELAGEIWTAFDDVALFALIKERIERDPSFDPHGIELDRLEFPNYHPFNPEAELHYLVHSIS
ncbi:hypothetical protein B0H12DRAFT_1128185 [Mycena haematopus]|nr:hypothetical protein B0H12DRAFT_1128185 [Mycena haematopus]